MTFIITDASHSVNAYVVDKFEHPLSAYGIANAYNVYDELDFRDDSFKPTIPYIYLLETRVPPKQQKLPTIFMEFEGIDQAFYEVGTRGGAIQVCHLHIFGRHRGERDQLASYLFTVLREVPSISILDYSLTTPTELYKTQVENVTSRQMAVSSEVALEAALSLWNTVSFTVALRG